MKEPGQLLDFSPKKLVTAVTYLNQVFDFFDNCG
jgi:hypothetical protein